MSESPPEAVDEPPPQIPPGGRKGKRKAEVKAPIQPAAARGRRKSAAIESDSPVAPPTNTSRNTRASSRKEIYKDKDTEAMPPPKSLPSPIKAKAAEGLNKRARKKFVSPNPVSEIEETSAMEMEIAQDNGDTERSEPLEKIGAEDIPLNGSASTDTVLRKRGRPKSSNSTSKKAKQSQENQPDALDQPPLPTASTYGGENKPKQMEQRFVMSTSLT